MIILILEMKHYKYDRINILSTPPWTSSELFAAALKDDGRSGKKIGKSEKNADWRAGAGIDNILIISELEGEA